MLRIVSTELLLFYHFIELLNSPAIVQQSHGPQRWITSIFSSQMVCVETVTNVELKQYYPPD